MNTSSIKIQEKSRQAQPPNPESIRRILKSRPAQPTNPTQKIKMTMMMMMMKMKVYIPGQNAMKRENGFTQNRKRRKVRMAGKIRSG